MGRPHRHPAAPWHLFLALLSVPVIIVLLIVRRYSTAILLPPSFKRLPPGSADGVRRGHRFVMLGGPHRGGTTILWKLLAAHPLVSSFDESHDTDFGEGAFLQTVLPTFGVGSETVRYAMPGAAKRAEGMGRYAFSPTAHLTEASPLNSNHSRDALLEEWGYHWDLSRPVLLEKTPTNMMTSRLLQALLAPAASFVFVTRHPLAVSLAHRRTGCCDELPLGELSAHWLVSHRVLASDLRHLAAARALRYEDLVQAPGACVGEITRWLGLPVPPAAGGGGGGGGGADGGQSAASAAPPAVERDTNRKYELAYCNEHLASPSQRRSHCAAAEALQPGIEALGLGYDVRRGGALGFACIGSQMATWEGSASSSSAEPGCPSVDADAGLAGEVATLRRLLERSSPRGGEGGGGGVAPVAERLLCARSA